MKRNQKSNSDNLEKLASGYQINRAGDDASGLAISEKMKAQITALGTAQNNVEDGVSLIQTAEGYMEEIHNMLNRMVELSEKSANGVLEDSGNTGYEAYGVSGGMQNAGTDRAALQLEMDQICAEIDRVAMTANFNGNKLFYMQNKEEMDRYYALPTVNAEFDLKRNIAIQVGETSEKSDKMVIHFGLMTTDGLFARSGRMDFVDITSNDGSSVATKTLLIANGGMNLTVDGGLQPFKSYTSANQKGLTINISDQAFASKAAEVIRDVIDDVSLQRAQLGATQNRLDYTYNNLANTEENIASSNSKIRDTDMAKEMMEYTQNNVLVQAAQSMLAQANTQPQNVLQLLS